jgi:hypothetical protein
MIKGTLFAYVLTIITVASIPVSAQQMTGTPGSPSATTTTDGAQIPPAAAEIRGQD